MKSGFILMASFFGFFRCCASDISIYSKASNKEIDGGYACMWAKFGPPLPVDGMIGMIQQMEPDIYGCNPMNMSEPPTTEWNGNWIALIERGHCNFENKVRAAQNLSWDMVIIYNNESGSMRGFNVKNHTGIVIRTVYVDLATGLKLKNRYQYTNKVYVVVEDDGEFPFDFSQDLLIPFVAVVGVCLLTLLCFILLKWLQDRRRQRRYRLPASTLRKIPTEKYTKNSPHEMCAICLDDYVEGEKLRVLPCHHAYHSKCVDPWLTKNRRVCPICKRKVFAADEIPVDGSDTDSDSENDERTPLVRPVDIGHIQALLARSLVQNMVTEENDSSSSSITSNIAQDADPRCPIYVSNRLRWCPPTSSSFSVPSTTSINSEFREASVGTLPFFSQPGQSSLPNTVDEDQPVDEGATSTMHVASKYSIRFPRLFSTRFHQTNTLHASHNVSQRVDGNSPQPNVSAEPIVQDTFPVSFAPTSSSENENSGEEANNRRENTCLIS